MKKLTTIGVLEEVHFQQRNASKIKDMVESRTVYSFKELQEIAKKPTLVLLFRWHFYSRVGLFYSAKKRMR